MVDEENITALIGRLGEASGADRELDCLIARAVGTVDPRTINNGFGFGYSDRGQWACSNVPAYTASLDAAMSMVAPAGKWSITAGHDGDWQAWVWLTDRTPPNWHSTPALALCIAALQAHLQQDGR